MKYIGSFKDLNNTPYRLEIITNGDSSETKEMVLAESPFVLSLEGGEEHLYKPAKYYSATISMVTNNYHFDLYSSTAQQNKVTLYKDNAIEWVGYLTPNLYNVGYENPEETIELEAIDALCTLQYYKYTPINGSKSIVSLKDILFKLFNKCNAYKKLYISKGLYKDDDSNNDLIPLMQGMMISEENFFDEDGEGMTMEEVLEEICKYLNVTAVAYKDSVLLIDYDALKARLPFFELDLTTNEDKMRYDKVNLDMLHSIVGSDYIENGGEISLDNVYNKATVKDSLYSFDSIIPSLWDDEYLTNYNGSGYIQEVNEEFKKNKYKCYFKYYKHKNYESYYYDKTNLSKVNLSNIKYADTQKYVGATICRHKSDKVSDYNKQANDLDFTDYLLLTCHDTIGWKQDIKRPLFKLTVNDSKPSFLGGDTYLIIKGNFLYMDRPEEIYIIEDYNNKDDDFNPIDLFIWARLQYGDKYWNGTEWTSTPSDFKLYYDDGGQTDHCINHQFQIKNNINWKMGLSGEEGYAIPMPDTTSVVTGKPTFTLYQPYKLAKSYRCDAVWLSNFDIIAKVKNLNTDVEPESDTEYTNVINEDYVNELGDTEFKICTWDSKEANFSAVVYKPYGSTTMKFIDKLKAPSDLTDALGLRPEEIYIARLVKQYSTPSVILDVNLKNDFNLTTLFTDKFLPNRVFILDSFEIDYINNKGALRLIEKK